MRRNLFAYAALIAAAAAFVSPAKAQNYTATPGTGLTFRAPLIGGALYPASIPYNGSGVELFTSGNAGNVQFASPPTVNLGTLNGAATAALQGTGNTSLASIDGKTPALGQALAAASVPVVLTAVQVSTLTPLSTVAVTQSTSPWVVSLSSTTITGSVTVAQATASSLNAAVVGNVASASSNSGNPVKIGGVYNTTLPSLSTGQRVDSQFDISGNQRVLVTGWSVTGTDGVPNTAYISMGNSALSTSAVRLLATANWLYNGTTLDRAPGDATNGAWVNVKTSVLATGAATSANQTNASQKTQIVDGSGNVIASTSNNLNVQCANCSGSGVSAADAASFTAGTSLFAPIGGQFTSGGATACVTGHECTAGMTAARAIFTDMASIAGTATLTGNGVTGTGSQRVTIASDNTAFGVNATLSAETTKVIGTTRTVGNVGGVMDAIGQNVTAPANWLQTGCQFNTSPTTISSGSGSPLQCNNAGNLQVNVVNATPGIANNADSIAAVAASATSPVPVNNYGYLYNGTTWDRMRSGTTTGSVLVNGAGTAGSASGGIMTVQGVASMTPLASNVTQVLGTAISTTNPLFSSITDGTTKAKVEPASTPAAVTDAALAVAPIPSELHVGEVGSNQIAVSQAPTVTASAYSAGNALGGLQTIANAARVSGSLGASGTGGIITGFNVSSKAAQSGVQIDIFIFNANPSGSTCTDKSAFVLAAADANKVIGVLTVPSTPANGGGWFSGGTGSIAMPTYFPITYDLSSATSLFACGVVRGAITPASTSDISYNYNILRN